MQNQSNQKYTVSNDAYQPFLRQHYRIHGGKKQWNIKKPSQSQTVLPTSPRGAGLLIAACACLLSDRRPK